MMLQVLLFTKKQGLLCLKLQKHFDNQNKKTFQDSIEIYLTIKIETFIEIY